jgi:Leucine-rich repeat (LRR) protein
MQTKTSIHKIIPWEVTIIVGFVVPIAVLVLFWSEIINYYNRPKITNNSDKIIAEAIGSQLNKNPNELTNKDYKKVQNLSLEGSNVVDLTILAKCTNLQILSLAKTQVIDISPLSNLTKLSQLYLYETKVSDIKPLESLRNLEFLKLDNTPVSDIKPLAKLTNLYILSLSGTQVNDINSLISTLTQMTKLQDLLLFHSKFDNSQISELRKALPRLRIVTVSNPLLM